MQDAACQTATPGTSGVSSASHLDAVVAQPGQRVDLLAVDAALVHLEVQVRAGGLTPVAQQRDRVARLHGLPFRDQDLLHVPVDGDVAVRVLDVDGQAEAAGGAGADDDAVRGRVLGG